MCSSKQTKEWRKAQDWYTTGKSNECEIYQRGVVERITGKPCAKTNKRLRLDDPTFFGDCSRPLTLVDGFEYTEDMDGLVVGDDGTKYYFNFKMVCCSGGAQTRTLREVYSFIRCQLEHRLSAKSDPIIFVNVLDGDVSKKFAAHFAYLLAQPKYVDVATSVFVGDSKTFQEWWSSLKSK